MKKALLATAILASLCQASWALSPEAEADMLKLEIKQSLDKESFSYALLPKFERIAELKVSNGESFEFLWGKVCAKVQEPSCAVTHLEKYISRYGRSGKYYEESLGLLSEAKAGVLAKVQKQQQAVAEMNARLQEVSPEVLLDTRWGLQWTRRDNGADVDWAQAQAYCHALGAGWSLPTVEVLQSLLDPDLPRVACGTKKECHISSKFQMSSWWAWSSDANGAEAWWVQLFSGDRFKSPADSAGIHRALCVRRP